MQATTSHGVGSTIKASVVETTTSGMVIVKYKNELLRATSAVASLCPGQAVSLKITATDPIEYIVDNIHFGYIEV